MGKSQAYRGNSRKNKAQLQALRGVREVETVCAEALAARHLDLLAQLWVYGAPVDWQQLYPVQPFRIALPTYPFARTRYWPECLKRGMLSVRNGITPHPLLGMETAPGHFVYTLRGDEFFLAEHIVQQQAILPGAAYIELARALGERSGLTDSHCISGLTWLTPLVFTGSPLELQTSLEQAEFTISSRRGEERVTHCIGHLLSTGEMRLAENASTLVLAEIQRHCPETRTRSYCYERFQALGVQYGASFQVLERVDYNQQEALALLRLPSVSTDRAAFQLHPSLLDGALQTALLLDLETGSDQTLSVPYAVSEIIIVGNLGERCYVHVAPPTVSHNGRVGERCRDIQIADENGHVVIYMRGVYARPLAGKRARTQAAINYYCMQWVDQSETSPTKVADHNYAARQSLLVIDAPDLAQQLRHHVARVVTVDAQTIWQPRRGDAPETILPALFEHEAIPDMIVLNLRAGMPSGSYEEQLRTEFARFFSLCKTLCASKLKKRVNLLILSQTQPKSPLQWLLYRALGSFCKTVHQEQPLLHFTLVEVQDNGNQRVELSPTTLLHLPNENEGEIRMIGSTKKQIQQVMPLTLPVQSSGQQFRYGGVYVITGGMGKIGWHIAEYVTRVYQARVVLCGRSHLNDEMRDRLARLRQKGAEALYVRADVTRRDDVRMILARARAAFGALHGIFHCAGVLQDGLLLRKTWQQAEQVLAPKILGAIYLDEETRDDALDCFVLCSSLVALTGNVGQSDYAYANRGMDEYAALRTQWQRRGERSGRSLSIRWSLWQDGGMHVTPETEARLKTTAGMVPLTTAQGLEALEQALATEEAQIIVAVGDQEKLQCWLSGGERAELPQDARPSQAEIVPAQVPTDESAIQKYVEELLKTVVAGETKAPLSTIDVAEPLEAYGIDSLLIVAITRKLEETFGELSKTLLFEYQTIAELARYFIEHHWAMLDKLLPATQPVSASEQVSTDQETRERDLSTVVPLDSQHHAPRKIEDDMPREALSTQQSEEDIAIIGMAGQFPMASTVEEFWHNLTEGQDCITEIPLERWDYRAFPQTMRWGGFMDDVDKFDPLFFHISNREAEWLDPQERLFLQTVYHTLEDAGYTRKMLAEARVGVYAGLMWAQYQLYGVEKANAASSYGSIANRVSYFFNFCGPSIALDTMCSSSLVSIHLACESLKSDETDMAIAGGVNLNIHPNKHLFLSTRGFAASDGRCRSFGEGGDGYVPGEGVGAVLLKPLSKAKQDGDRIYAVIKATVTNHGGKTNGYTVPNPRAQTSLITDALRKANIDPRTISYIEAHGTGTALGDPIEITGLTNAFKPYTNDTQFCAIGSVKSNIGHLEGAAGIASIIKVILQMQHRQLVPSIHSETLNKHIDFGKTPFYVQRELTAWPRPMMVDADGSKEYLCLAGVSSFGAGGANAHIILEEYPQRITSTPVHDTYLVTLSAKDSERLKAYARSLLEYLVNRPLPQREASTPASSAQQQNVISTRVLECIAQILGVSVSFIDMDDVFEDYGLSHAQTQQLLRKLQDEFSVTLTANDLALQQSPRTLIAYIQQMAVDSARSFSGENTDPAQHITLANIAYTLQTGREAMEARLAIIAATVEELVEKLESYLASEVDGESILTGNLGIGENAAGSPENPIFLEQLLRNRRLQKLARLWCKGVAIDWRALYNPREYQRIALPLYPFAKERCWVTDPTLVGPMLTRQQPAPVHPAAPSMGQEPEMPHPTSAWQEEVLERFFYKPQWVELPGVRLTDTLIDHASASSGTSLIIYGANAQPVKQALMNHLLSSTTFEIMLGKETRLVTQNCWTVDIRDPGALGLCLGYIKDLATVYFLGGIQTAPPRLEDTTLFKTSQDEGMITLLRLVKALDEQGLMCNPRRLVIATNNVHTVVPGESTRPFAASLLGLARAVAKEYPGIKTTLIDLDLIIEGTTEDQQARALIEEQDQSEMAIRKGVAYRRRLVPVHLPTSEQIPFVHEGCYVILGGSGNVGMKVSRYLAETANARLVWFGRRVLDQELRDKMRLIEQAGGEVHYFKVDVAHYDEMLQAMRRVEATLGHINGVFHSALDFQIMRLRDLDEDALHRAISAKIMGTLVLWQVLQQITIDILVLFSSGEAFTGNAGWAAYGAACSFQDALGLFLTGRERYHTHIINWGFWDGNERGNADLLKLKGIYPISYENGMEALRRVLAENVRQVMALHVDDRMLALMGVDLQAEQQNGHQPATIRSAEPAEPLRSITTQPTRNMTLQAEGKGNGPQHLSSVAIAEAPLGTDAQERLSTYLIDLLAETLKIDRAKLDPRADLARYGVDSLLVIGIHKELEDRLGKLPATLLIEQPSVEALTRYLMEKHRDIVERVLDNKAGLNGDNNGSHLTNLATTPAAPSSLQGSEASQVLNSPKMPPHPVPQAQLSGEGIQIVRVVEAADIPRFLEQYGQAYRQNTLKQGMSEQEIQDKLDASQPQLVQALVKISTGKEIEVVISGKGAPLLFLPAVALTAPVWYHQFTTLSSRYQTIVIHAPGYGLSETIDNTSTRAVGDVFIEVLDRLHLHRPLHLVASCFGSIAAQYLAKTYRDRVASLTMCGGFYEDIGLPDISPDKLSVEELFALTTNVSASLKKDFDHIIDLLGGSNPQAAQHYQWCSNLLLNSQCASPMIGMRYLNELLTLSTLDWLSEIIAPTLCITGNYDTVVDPNVARIMSGRIPFAHLLEISGAGHYPFLTHPEIFNEHLVRHIEEQEARLSEN